MEVNSPHELKASRYGPKNLFRLSDLSIGKRLFACFVAIVVLMIAVDGLTVWQFGRMAAAVEGLSNADQTSLAVIKVHLDIDTFRDKMAALANSHDTQQFSSEVASLEQPFLQDVGQAEQMLRAAGQTEQNAAISSALETLKVTLPSQLNTAIELANAGDWTAVRLRLGQQMQDLIGLSASLVERVDQQTSLERTEAIKHTQEARQNLSILGPIAALLTLLAAAALGWYVTRTITVPLGELTAGAEALARGDFQQRSKIFGNDELSVLGKAFNYAAGQLQELYQGLSRSEAELRDLIENIPAMVFIALPGPSNAFASRRWREYTGLSEQDTTGAGWQSVVHLEDLERHIEKWRACSATGEMLEDEARFRRAADGEYRWFLVRAVPLRDETGVILKWYGVLADIEDRKRAEELTLEVRVSERTRIARELHDTLLQSFQGLLLRFQSVMNILPERPREARQRLDSAIQQAAEAITEGRDAVQGLRSSAFQTNDLAKGIAAIAEELTTNNSAVEGPVLDLVLEGAPRKLQPMVRDETYRIAAEALRNAFRHAQARRIMVEIRYDKRQFRLRVRDDGKGISVDTMREQPARHFGLPGMRERAEIVGGKLEVWSQLDSGTQVELSIPGSIAYDVSAR